MRRSLIVIAVFLVAVSASATVMLRHTLDQVRDRAQAIFTGRVMQSSLVPVMDGKLQATEYVIEVETLIEGAVGKTTTVAYLNAGYNGSPLLEIGERYLFFKTGPQNNTTVGWGQGVYHIETTGDQTILVSGDGESLVMVDGKLARGASLRASAESTPSDPQDKPGIAHNVDGTAAIRMRAAPLASTNEKPVFATLDDVRHFVAAGKEKR
ncbi:MAG TPA: hypothetical protein VGK04_04535 [Thermoanaerobaculia bacterium]